MPRPDDETSIFPPGAEPASGAAPRRGSGAPRSGGAADRDLILDAFRQADAATDAGSSHAPGGSQTDLPINFFPGYVLKGEIHRGGQGVVYRAE